VGSDGGQAEELKAELDKCVADTSKRMKWVKNRLREVDEETNEKASAGDQQMRRTQAASLRKRFVGAAQEYQKVEQAHRQKIRERMERQFRVVNPNATQEEVDAMLAGDANIFAQDVLGTGRRGEARRALQEVQDRHEDVRKIEQTILELSQLFQEMAQMVDSQGGMMDSIENSVSSAAQYTEEAVVHLDKAIEHRLSARKKLWILTGIAAVVLFIVILMIYLYIIRPAMSLVPTGGGSSSTAAPTAQTQSTTDGTTQDAGSSLW